MGAVASVPNYVASAASDTNKVLAMPLLGNVDTVHLFLTLGVVLLSVLIWSRILAHIKG
jgi:hypothetical protein